MTMLTTTLLGPGWIERALRRWLASRRRARLEPHEADYASLASLSDDTLRDIGAPCWVHPRDAGVPAWMVDRARW